MVVMMKQSWQLCLCIYVDMTIGFVLKVVATLTLGSLADVNVQNDWDSDPERYKKNGGS